MSTYLPCPRNFNANYYDNYDFDFNGTADYTYDNAHLSGQDATASVRTRGLPTGSTRVIMNSDETLGSWLITAVFYDQYDRPIQVQGNNPQYTAGLDKQTTIYDFVKAIKTKTTHRSSASVALDIVDHADYDHAGRVKVLYRKIGSGTDQVVAEYVYNSLGQLSQKKLHKKPDNSFLQTVDLAYTISGDLKKINDPNSIGDDFFAQELYRNDSLGGMSHVKAWNGNITAVKWKEGFGNSVSTDLKTYAYQYYKHDQLKEAKYSEGTSFAKNVGLYNEESVTYDVNGNIKTLQRKGKNDLGVAATIDNLAYTYSATNTNALVKVEDSGTTAGFNNGATDAAEFTYDANGNATKDKNKDITAIAYNSLGKPKQVTFGNGRVLKYSYDASGVKIKLEEYQSTTLFKTTKYMSGYVYENDTLRYFGSPEGLVVVNGSNYEYQYAIRDHQGNTRAVFTAKDIVTQSSFADFESTSNASFQNYPTGGNRNGVNLYDHTDAGTAKTYSTLLNGGYNSQIGVAKSFKVYPGDKLKIEAYAKYSNPTSTSSNITAFASALLSAFGVPAPGMGEAGTMSSGLNGWGTIVATGSGGTSTDPKIFVNIILFDKNYNFVDFAYDKIASSAQQVGVSPVVAHDYMTIEKVVEEEGYAFLYISNENNTQVDAYFDDVTMSYTPSRVVQHSDFYAFGLQTDNSWTRGTNVNKYLYNSGSELNKTTGSYEMYFRNYDPAIARMSGVDVMADSYSSLTPYQYANNSPVYFSDPTGAWSSVYESAANGGCGCWRDKGPQDGGGNAKDTYGSASISGSAYGKYGVAPPTQQLSAWQMMKDAQAVDKGEMTPLQYAEKYLASSMYWIGPKGGVEHDGKTYLTYLTQSGEWHIVEKEQVPEQTAGQVGNNTFNLDKWSMLTYTLETSIHNGTDDAIKLGAYTKGATNLARGLGFGFTALNVGLTYLTLKKEYKEGTINTHSFVNAGVTIVTAGAAVATVIIGVAAAPVWLTAIGVGGAIYGIVYGIDQISGGRIGINDGINNLTNDWGKQFNK